MLGNVARVCRRPLEGRLNWYEYERARMRKKERERRTERANETPGRGDVGGRGEPIWKTEKEREKER